MAFDFESGKAPGGLDSVFIFAVNCLIIVVFGIELGLWPIGPIVLFPTKAKSGEKPGHFFLEFFEEKAAARRG